jgi:hypothetical protein
MHIPSPTAATNIKVDVQEDELLVERRKYNCSRTQCVLESWLGVLKLTISYNRHVHALKEGNIRVTFILCNNVTQRGNFCEREFHSGKHL